MKCADIIFQEYTTALARYENGPKTQKLRISHKITQNREYLCKYWCNAIGAWQARCTLRNTSHDAYFDVAMATVLVPVSFLCKSNVTHLLLQY